VADLPIERGEAVSAHPSPARLRSGRARLIPAMGVLRLQAGLEQVTGCGKGEQRRAQMSTDPK
jgi:hypothetical protein